MGKLRKAGPPPIPGTGKTPPPVPAAAFKAPPKAAMPNVPTMADFHAAAKMPSPWDDGVVSSAPKPAATHWMGRPIFKPEHHDELEQAAAVNQFGLGMPKKAAEDAAYSAYTKKYAPKTAMAPVITSASPIGKSEDLSKGMRSAPPMWLERVVSHRDHIPSLEQAAAIHEFGHKLPRHEAEKKAYEDYKKGQHQEAAAFHLRGMKAAQAAGDHDAARKHATMYQLHVKRLGHELVGMPHPDVVAHMENSPDKLVRFKAHRGDMFVLPKE